MAIKNWTPERLAQRNVWKQRWRQKNREHLLAYRRVWAKIQSRKHRDKILALRPPKPESCQCCSGKEFRWFNKTWECVPCRVIRTRNNKRIRSRKETREKCEKKHIEHIRLKLGDKAAELYVSLRASNPDKKTSSYLLSNLCLPTEFKDASRNCKEKIHLLNALTNQPAGTIGWTCKHCSLSSDNYMFFDIDHILPKSRSGHNKKSNLQVLCPNCHRLKTISDFHQKHYNKILCAITTPSKAVT